MDRKSSTETDPINGFAGAGSAPADDHRLRLFGGGRQQLPRRRQCTLFDAPHFECNTLNIGPLRQFDQLGEAFPQTSPRLVTPLSFMRAQRPFSSPANN